MKLCKIRYFLQHDFMTSLDDSFILTCIYILGAEYIWIKSEFLKYKNILSESKRYTHIELRLYNTKLYFEINLLFHFLYMFSSGLVLYYTNLPLILHDIILEHYLNIFPSCLVSTALLISSQKWDLNVSINPCIPLFWNYHCHFSFLLVFSVSYRYASFIPSSHPVQNVSKL